MVIHRTDWHKLEPMCFHCCMDGTFYKLRGLKPGTVKLVWEPIRGSTTMPLVLFHLFLQLRWPSEPLEVCRDDNSGHPRCVFNDRGQRCRHVHLSHPLPEETTGDFPDFLRSWTHLGPDRNSSPGNGNRGKRKNQTLRRFLHLEVKIYTWTRLHF